MEKVVNYTCKNCGLLDSPGALDEPTDSKDQELFYEALTYAAKLYDLEGLSTQEDKEAKEYFEKALTRADRLPDKILSSRIRIHIARLVHRLRMQPATYYTDVLATLDALNLTALDSFQQSDIINLKLVCCYQLGNLMPFDQSKSWYQRQMGLAKEYGALDFQVLAHKRLAEIAVQQGRDQSAFSQFRSFQVAYAHAKQAYEINRKFANEGVRTVEFDEIIQLTFSVANEIMEIFSKEPL